MVGAADMVTADMMAVAADMMAAAADVMAVAAAADAGAGAGAGAVASSLGQSCYYFHKTIKPISGRFKKKINSYRPLVRGI